jgi:hypothetical protein
MQSLKVLAVTVVRSPPNLSVAHSIVKFFEFEVTTVLFELGQDTSVWEEPPPLVGATQVVFWYVVRRFGPPQNSDVALAQTIPQSSSSEMTEPAASVLPQ